jgi:hypothetical protein
VRGGVAVAVVVCVESGFFKGVVDFAFIFFGDVKNEWSEAGIAVFAVLFPGGCASDSDYYASTCFADFYG